MSRVRPLPTALIMMLSSLLFTACSFAENTAQTCQRLATVQEEIAQFESAPQGNPAQRVATVQGFAVDLEHISRATGDAQLEFAAATLAQMYSTIAEGAASHPELESMELMRLIGHNLEIDRINAANETYLRVCPDTRPDKEVTDL